MLLSLNDVPAGELAGALTAGEDSRRANPTREDSSPWQSILFGAA
jgi:hypothetical protein